MENQVIILLLSMFVFVGLCFFFFFYRFKQLLLFNHSEIEQIMKEYSELKEVYQEHIISTNAKLIDVLDKNYTALASYSNNIARTNDLILKLLKSYK